MELRRAHGRSLRLRLRGADRVWGLSLGLAALAALAYWLVSSSIPPLASPVRVPWWVLTPLFLLAEVFVVHVQLRRDAFSFSLSEIPLVIGLFFSPLLDLLVAQVVGAALALAIHRRQALVKLVFNLSHLALETIVAVAVVRSLGWISPAEPSGWIAAMAATLLASAMADLAVYFAIGLADGTWRVRILTEGLAFGKVTVLANTSLGLAAAVMLWRDPASVWLQAVPVVTVIVAYRAYTGQRLRREGLESLYEASRSVGRTVRLEEAVAILLDRTREMFRAELADVVLFDPEDPERARGVGLGPGDEPAWTSVRLDPTRGVWARVVAEDRGVLLPRPIENETLRAHFHSLGMRDLMVAPLHGEQGVIGVFRVANRLGEVGTFDQDDLKLFETLASHAGVALENARLVARLEESLEHLSELNRMKDDFISTVSHELRTPLTIVTTSVQGLRRGVLDEDQQRTFLEAAARGSERLGNLIEQLLIVARIESGPPVAALEPVALPPVVTRVVEELQARTGGHEVVAQLDPSLPQVRSDEGKIHQILSNLIENAMKYSPEGTTVRIGAAAEPAGVIVWVADEGEGVPAAHGERIFERFYQVDSSSTRRVGGTGLGLYISRSLAEELGGRLWLERSGHGGSEFRLFLPVGEPQAPDTPGERRVTAG